MKPNLLVVAAFAVHFAACSDLLPDIPDAISPDTLDDASPIETADGQVATCTTDQDCAEFAGCCIDPVCREGVCMPSYVLGCCTVVAPCPATAPLLRGYCDAPCEPQGCIESLRLDDRGCDGTLYELALTPEGLSGLTIDDPTPDRVAWHLSALRPFAGAPSLRAGDVLCPSYHSGPLDSRCRPLGEGGPVRIAFDTPPIALPAEVAALVELWVYADLPESDGLTTPLDGLELQIVPIESGVAFPVWSTRLGPIEAARWTPVLVDAARWAGLTVRVRAVFDTLDGRDNDHEGIALGRVRVRTACADDRIAPDRGVCEIAWPTIPYRLDEVLMVFGPPDPTAACAPCEAAADCATHDACEVAACTQGRCDVRRELTAQCCTADPRWQSAGDFEGPLAEGWSATGSWAPSNLRSLSGEGALHFGRPDGSGIADPGERAAGETLSPPLVVPEEHPRWRFWLWLGTEWDAAPSSDNPLGLDLLEALVWPVTTPPLALAPTALWTSREIGGTTRGEWLEVTVDLDAWRGRTVRLGWRFDTGDADANEAEGVWIDGAEVYRDCSAVTAESP